MGTTAVADFDVVYFLVSCLCMPSINEAVSDNECDSRWNTVFILRLMEMDRHGRKISRTIL